MLKVNKTGRKMVQALMIMIVLIITSWCLITAAIRTELNSGVGKTLKMPYSTLALNMDYIGLAGGLDLNYFHWCVSPIDDDQGKTHLFLSRWPANLGMGGWCTNGELAHYVGNSAEGPFTFVNKVLDNSTVPSSWMVSPHNVRIKKIDNTYVIVYITQDSRVGNQRGQKIGMLTSSSLNGPWTPVGPGGVVVQPSTDPNNWAYNGLLGVDNPDFDKVNGKYYIYFKAGPAMNGTMHYGYAEATTLTGTYTICSTPMTDNIDYLEDATAFSWDGYEYLLTTDNFGANTGIFGAGILWRADSPNSPGPFHMSNAKIGFGVLSDYTTIPGNATYNYTSWDKFERPAVLMRNGKPAYFYGADSCNVSGANVTGTYILRCNTDGSIPTATPTPLPPTGALNRTGWTASGTGSGFSNALDGNMSTRWETGAYQTNGQYFQVDMQSAKTFNQIRLDATGYNNDYPRGYAVYVSNDGSNWGSAIATGSGSGPITDITFSSRTARYIKVVQTGSSSTNWWGIFEFNVYNTGGSTPTPTPTPGGALNRTGWTASGTGSGFSNALDGNMSTRWETGAYQTNGQYFQVDMQSVKTFNQIRLDATGYDNDYPRGYAVYVSNDGSNWGSAVATGSGSGPITDITFSSRTARYIKVVQTGSSSTNWWGIFEFNVYNSGAPTPTPTPGPAKYEAESGTVGNGATIANDSAASGGKCIQNLHITNSYCQINNINGGSGGSKTLNIIYAANGTGTLSIYVNGTLVASPTSRLPVVGVHLPAICNKQSL